VCSASCSLLIVRHPFLLTFVSSGASIAQCRAPPRLAKGGGALLAFALACSLCSSGRVSWCGRSWIIVNGVCAHPYPPSAIAICLRWGGVGLVVSRSRARLRACAVWGVGDMHARRCVVPWLDSRPSGDPKTTTNPHRITLELPPVSQRPRGAGFQLRFKNRF